MESKSRRTKYKLLILLGFITLISLRFPTKKKSITYKEQPSSSLLRSVTKSVDPQVNEKEPIEPLERTTDIRNEVGHQNYNEVISCYPEVSGNKWDEVFDSISKNYPTIFEQKVNRHYKAIDG